MVLSSLLKDEPSEAFPVAGREERLFVVPGVCVVNGHLHRNPDDDSQGQGSLPWSTVPLTQSYGQTRGLAIQVTEDIEYTEVQNSYYCFKTKEIRYLIPRAILSRIPNRYQGTMGVISMP